MIDRIKYAEMTYVDFSGFKPLRVLYSDEQIEYIDLFASDDIEERADFDDILNDFNLILEEACL